MNKIMLLRSKIQEAINNAQDKHKSIVNKSESTADGLMFALGVVFILVYFLMIKFKFFSQFEQLGQFLVVLGITFSGNSFFSFYKRRMVLKNDEFNYKRINNQIGAEFDQNECISWIKRLEDNNDIVALMNSGLVNVHYDRENVYRIMEDYLNKNKGAICEVICYDGIDKFRDIFKSDLLCKYLNEGLQLKILSANSNASYWTQHEIDMYVKLEERREYDVNPLSYNYRNEIKEMKNNWFDIIERQTIDKSGKFEIKFYNSLPSLFLIRMNNILFISSKLIGDTNVSNPPIFEYRKVNNGKAEIYNQYKNYFNRIWNDPDLSTKEQEVLLNPQLLIGNKVVNKILQNACNAMTDILRAACPDEYAKSQHFPLKIGADQVKAFFTLLDYAEPYINSGGGIITRRYNTNVVTRRYDNIGINSYNGRKDLDEKGYPITYSHAIGYVMVKGEGLFRTIDQEKEPQDSEDIKSCVSLVLPLKIPSESRNEAIIDYVFEGEYTLSGVKIPNTRQVNGHYENNYSKASTKVIATVTFEFYEEIRHIIISDETRNYECDIFKFNKEKGYISSFEGYTFNTKDVTRRLVKEAERCQKLLLEYFGFNSGSVYDADTLIDDALL